MGARSVRRAREAATAGELPAGSKSSPAGGISVSPVGRGSPRSRRQKIIGLALGVSRSPCISNDIAMSQLKPSATSSPAGIDELPAYCEEVAHRAHAAARLLATARGAQKNDWL